MKKLHKYHIHSTVNLRLYHGGNLLVARGQRDQRRLQFGICIRENRIYHQTQEQIFLVIFLRLSVLEYDSVEFPNILTPLVRQQA